MPSGIPAIALKLTPESHKATSTGQSRIKVGPHGQMHIQVFDELHAAKNFLQTRVFTLLTKYIVYDLQNLDLYFTEINRQTAKLSGITTIIDHNQPQREMS